MEHLEYYFDDEPAAERPGKIRNVGKGDEPIWATFDDAGNLIGLIDLDAEEASDAAPAPAPAVVVDERRAHARYLVDECNLTPTTAHTYSCALDRLESFLGMPPTHALVDDVRRFLRETNFHPSTKSGALVALKSLHRWGSLEGKAWANPALSQLRAPKQIRNPKPALSSDEARTLVAACRRPNDFRLIHLGLFGGLRVTESASIGFDEWTSDRLRFEGKGRKVREVPVHPVLKSAQANILANSTSRGTLKQTARSLAFYTGVDFTSHTLRRTFAVTLSELGVGREVIGALLGHAPLGVTESYAPVRWQEKCAAIEALTYE